MNLTTQPSENPKRNIQSKTTIVVPGDRIQIPHQTQHETLKAGTGCHSHNGTIQFYSSLLGEVVVQKETEKTEDGEKKKNLSSVLAVKPLHTNSTKITNPIPSIDSIVIAKVQHITSIQAFLHILVVNNQPTSTPYHAKIRKQDVRVNDQDKVRMDKCFRPGDIVR